MKSRVSGQPTTSDDTLTLEEHPSKRRGGAEMVVHHNCFAATAWLTRNIAAWLKPSEAMSQSNVTNDGYVVAADFMKLTLHPKVGRLVQEEVWRQNALPKTKRQLALKTKPLTPKELVNELLWCVLRTGDISKHYLTTDRMASKNFRRRRST